MARVWLDRDLRQAPRLCLFCRQSTRSGQIRLDAYRLPDGASAGFENDRVGIGRPIRWNREGVTHISYEPTDSYHRAMKRQLGDVGYPAVKATTR